MLKGSTIACAVELMVELSALSNLPTKVSFLIRMRQAIDGRFIIAQLCLRYFSVLSEFCNQFHIGIVPVVR